MKRAWDDLQELLVKLNFWHNEVYDYYLVKSEHDYIFVDWMGSDKYCVLVTYHGENEPESIKLIWDDPLLLEKAEKFVRSIYKELPVQDNFDMSVLKSFFWFDGE